jgi:hypothetical protein
MALATLALSAQKGPDFSGVWVAVSPARFAGQQVTILHDEMSLTVLQGAEPGQEHGNIYQLDGTPERDVENANGVETVTITTAAWVRDRVVVTRALTTSRGRKIDSTLTFSLNRRGELLQELIEVVNGETQPAVTLLSKKKGS